MRDVHEAATIAETLTADPTNGGLSRYELARQERRDPTGDPLLLLREG